MPCQLVPQEAGPAVCPRAGENVMMNHSPALVHQTGPNLGFINWKLLLKNSKDTFLQLFSALSMIRMLISQLEMTYFEALSKLQEPRFERGKYGHAGY